MVICKRQGAVHAVASDTVTMRNGAGWGDCAKCDRMVAFGEALSKLRRKLKRDLALSGLPREKMLAVVVGLLDATRVRIGNTEYARDNTSFSLTTLLDRHVSFIRDGGAILNLRGKGGVRDLHR